MPRIDELFRCPECGGSRLEEVMANVTVASKVVALGEGGDAVYGNQSNEGGEVVRYQCMDCGWTIDGVCNAEELHEYLGAPGNPGANCCDCEKPGYFCSGIPGILAHMARTRIVIVIHDTVVQGAYCSDPDAELVVVDWDVERCDPFMDGTVTVPGNEGETHHADVYRLTAIPLEQLPGTHTYEALQRAGMSDDMLCHFVEVAVPETLHPQPVM